MRRSPLRSPPRMRGKVVVHGCVVLDVGITPAYAGKSPPAKRKNPAIWDHPRVCGEKIPSSLNWPMFLGSPPRVRGKAAVRGWLRATEGITPACAGKSQTTRRVFPVLRDHPRVCGEKRRDRLDYYVPQGSPPRVRGKVASGVSERFTAGITPACAGKSDELHVRHIAGEDHPRVCGEKDMQEIKATTEEGSPPRVRGKVQELHPQGLGRGITPACAGKSWSFLNAARTSPWITPACAGKRLKKSHSIGHFSYILCLFHSVLHRASASGGSRAGPCAPPCLPAQNAVPV